MSHSATYYEHQRSSNSSPPAHHYPQHLVLARPPAAYVGHWHCPVESYKGDGTYVKQSVSSATSSSSGVSDFKTYSLAHPYPFVLQAESGLMGKSSSSHTGRPPGNRDIRDGIIGGQEMVEDHSAVIRYIHHDDQEDEPKEQHHGIWILVSRSKILAGLGCLTYLSSGYHCLTRFTACSAASSRYLPCSVLLSCRQYDCFRRENLSVSRWYEPLHQCSETTFR